LGANVALVKAIRAILLIAVVVLGLPTAASGAILTKQGDTLRYVATRGEVNTLEVGRGFFLVPVITFKDEGVSIQTDDPRFCNRVGGLGICRLAGISEIYLNVKDKDDTVTIDASKDEQAKLPKTIATRIIGGRGIDVLLGGNGPDKLKGNAGTDSLRGRKGHDKFKGGRGSDKLYALDGGRDRTIRCGEGRRDLVKYDRGIDPRPIACEITSG